MALSACAQCCHVVCDCYGLSTRAAQRTLGGVPHHLVSEATAQGAGWPGATRLEQLIRDVAAEHDWTIIELAIQPDHVHLFMRVNPYTPPSDVPRLFKGRSSHVLREEFPHLLKLPSLWTRSFFLSTA